jgi:hypothetical protein
MRNINDKIHPLIQPATKQNDGLVSKEIFDKWGRVKIAILDTGIELPEMVY